MIITRHELNEYLNQVLKPQDFADYGPNGLQIEGREDIKKIAFAVSATRDSITKCVEQNADALIVHHGLFWSFHGPRTITGPFARRVKPLIENNINLWGYHLPLDANLEVGNALGIAKELELKNLNSFGDYKGSPTGVSGEFDQSMDSKELKSKLEKILKHTVLHAVAISEKKVKSIGIITGGANGGWSEAAKRSLDAYITGEMSEHDWHESSESDIHMYAGGHHSTERFGVQALMEKVSKDLQLDCIYIESENPA